MHDNPLLEKMLCLPEFKIEHLEHNEHDIRMYVKVNRLPYACPACGSVCGRYHLKQKRKQEIRDLNIGNKRVGLSITRRKFKCLDCDSLFYEPLDCVTGKGRMTDRLRDYIAHQAQRRSFTEIAQELALSDVTVRKAFLESTEQIQLHYEIATPRVLGIDEIYVNKEGKRRKQAYGVVCNGVENTVIEMLPNRNKKTVSNFFATLKEPEKVEVVTMDMWSTYRDSVYATLPNAVCVVDRFHVVKMANTSLDTYRKKLFAKIDNKKSLKTFKKDKLLFLMREKNLGTKSEIFRDSWFSEYPEFKVAYNLKEQLFDVYEAETRDEAIKLYNAWLEAVPSDLHIFDDLITSFENWGHEIFNYFDHRYTNAFVEGINSSIRAIEKQGRSYDFEVLRAKVIFTIGHKREIKKYGSDIMFRTPDQFATWFEDDNLSQLDIAVNLGYFNLIIDYGVPFTFIIDSVNEGLL